MKGFPTEAYAGKRRLCPPPCKTSFRERRNHSSKRSFGPVARQASSSRCAVPPPEPSGVSTGSLPANHSVAGRSPKDVRLATILGGNVKSNCVDCTRVALSNQEQP